AGTMRRCRREPGPSSTRMPVCFGYWRIQSCWTDWASNSMTHEEAGKFWNENANTWTALARAGYDVYRDYVNTPAFLEMLPEVRGLEGLDIGCGEGHNTRL